MSEKQWAWIAFILSGLIVSANIYVTYFINPELPPDILLASIAIPFWGICTIVSLYLLITEYRRG